MGDPMATSDKARAMGYQKWAIPGGKPMLRQDFPDLCDYLTGKSISYSRND
jgi:molybdenum cofactor biosynthesis enzyme MoaA